MTFELDDRDLDELVAMGAKFYIDGVEVGPDELRRELFDRKIEPGVPQTDGRVA